MKKKANPVDDIQNEAEEAVFQENEDVQIEEAEPDAESLKAQLAAAVKLNEEFTDKLQRNLAEFDNFRKRTMKEKASMYDDGVRDTMSKILPVVDNFERAVGSCPDKEHQLYKGLDMVLKQLKGVMTDIGVAEIDTVSFTFDPILHHAVSHVEDDNYGENEIIEELQKGYTFKEKVIRPSMVQVAN